MNINNYRSSVYPENGEDYKNSCISKYKDMVYCRKKFREAQSAFFDAMFFVNLTPECERIILELREFYFETIFAAFNASNAYNQKNADKFEDYCTATSIFSALTIDAANRAERIISIDKEDRAEMAILKEFETVL